MREPTSFDLTNVLLQKLITPVKEFVAKELRRFFERGEATSYLVQLGTITADYTSGKPKVKFDRDTEASGKAYEHIASYTPAANDRVLLQRCGRTWVIIGKLS